MRIGLQAINFSAMTLAIVGGIRAEQITSTCRITAVDAMKGTVTLARQAPSGEKTGVCRVAGNAEITLDTKPVALSGIQPPVEASVVYDTEQRAAIVIRVGAATPSVPPTLPNGRDEDGFVNLFDGKTLQGWQGATDRYHVENGKIVVDFGPQMYTGPGSNLFTVKEYKNFVLRLDYSLSEGANNGILLRSPLGDDAWKDALEVQLIDDSAPQFRQFPAWYLNAAIFDVVAPRPGHSMPIGQWNSLEIKWDHRQFKVTLNSAVVIDTNLDSASDKVGKGLNHPGLRREKGHIAMLGAAGRGRVEFRNIRIKEITGND